MTTTICTASKKSLSARRAWIEMPGADVGSAGQRVALRKESVDRNTENAVLFLLTSGSLSARRAWIEIKAPPGGKSWRIVALRKESVDRNLWWGVRKAVGSLVALRKESVDRNLYYGDDLTYSDGSLSARRAWIEIYDGLIASANFCRSLSARRAWIEIPKIR